MTTIVIARYQEDLGWLRLVQGFNLVVLDKRQLGNRGREAASYLYFILQNYAALAGDYVFCQGDPFAHCAEFDAVVGRQRFYGERYRCDWTGQPQHLLGPLPIRAAVDGIALQFVPETLEFTAGAQFMASAEQIRRTPRRQYEAAAMISQTPTGPWVLERLWDYLIPAID